ncbi:hypothetical protein [Achromobacter mucicolens]|uniref:hypothetical protein n=1 Tax=Achromobacter mucicolens TaxID=1389922 RepID=UPI00289B90DC|nr:hypothetical protein [Achromobacter mucicolens]
MNRIPTHPRPALAGLFLAASLAASAAAAQDNVPQIMQVPADNSVAWRAPAEGVITYECRMIQTDRALRLGHRGRQRHAGRRPGGIIGAARHVQESA